MKLWVCSVFENIWAFGRPMHSTYSYDRFLQSIPTIFPFCLFKQIFWQLSEIEPPNLVYRLLNFKHRWCSFQIWILYLRIWNTIGLLMKLLSKYKENYLKFNTQVRVKYRVLQQLSTWNSNCSLLVVLVPITVGHATGPVPFGCRSVCVWTSSEPNRWGHARWAHIL